MRKDLNRLVNLSLILLGTFSQLYLLLDTTGCTVSPYFPLGVATVCVILWFGAHARHGILICLSLAGVLAAGFGRTILPDLTAEFQDFCDRITGVFYEAVLYRGRSYPYLNAVHDHTILFLAISILIAGYLSMALSSRGARTSLVMIGSLPLFLICVLINETPLSWTVLGYALFLFLTASGGSFYWEESHNYSGVLFTAIPLTLLLCLLLFYINPGEYTYEPPKVDLREEIKEGLRAVDQWAENLMQEQEFTLPEFLNAPYQERREEQFRQEELLSDTNRGTETTSLTNGKPSLIWQGTEGMLDLTQAASAEELDRVFLRVKTNGSGRLYLRGSSFGDYTGTGWLPASNEAEGSSLAFAANVIAAVGGEENTMTIRDTSSSAYRFLPYFSQQEEGIDSYVPSDGTDRYDASFFTIPSLSGITELPAADENEIAYRSYAHTVYTRLPDSTKAAILPVLAQAGIYPGGENLIAGVAAFVQNAGRYDLNTPAYPSSDYASYFLTTAHQGYCIHFATAAAAAYRCLGIPARVTAGFVTETIAGRYTDVKGADAHAWVEIYQDGIGWIPVEVTGQSGADEGIPGAGETERDVALGESKEETTEAEEEGTVLPQESREENQGEELETETQADDSAVEEDRKETPQPQLPIGPITQPVPQTDTEALQKQANIRKAVLLFVILVLPAAVVLIRRAILLTYRRHVMEQKNTHKAVIAVYRFAEKVASFGEEIPKEVRSCAEKASFSAHPVTEEEAADSRAHLQLMRNRVFSRQSVWNRFRFKYLKALI